MKLADNDLFNEFLTGSSIDRLGTSLCIIENPRTTDPEREFPIRGNTTISIIVFGGSMNCIVDMAIHSINVPGMLLILPSQIVESLSFSDDFKGYCIIMAAVFLDNMPMNHKVLLIGDVRRTGFYPMDGQMIEVIENYAKMVQSVLRIDNNYKNEVVTHLTIAYYYGLGTYIHKMDNDSGSASRYEQISKRFLELVRDNCDKRRDMEFYADSLCLSAKHINLAVKTVTGSNAMKWIERYTVLRAKSLLKTTALSISEISDSLNFSTPSDFGKYFKKFSGYSPKAFRNA